jgi:mono/diheme cytochrome c family protein
MYGNAVEVNKAEELQADGYLAHMKYRTGKDSKDLFNRACGSCHTINGYRPLAPRYNGTDSAFIAGTIRGATVMRGNMPPFLGTDRELGMIASYIASKVDHRHISDIYNLSGLELGTKVYEIRCGVCHVVGGYNDKTSSLVGLDIADYNDLLDYAGDIAEQMPPFTGDQAERDALIEYFQTLKEGGQ